MLVLTASECFMQIDFGGAVMRIKFLQAEIFFESSKIIFFD